MAKAVVLFNYSPSEDDELYLVKGDIIEVLESKEEWWECCDSDGNRGVAPFNYLRLMEDNQDELPNGWEKFSDPETGEPYYFNHDTGTDCVHEL